MSRHDFDPVALVFGAFFTVLGLGYAIDGLTWFDLDARWTLAALLVLLGVAGIVGATRDARVEPRPEPAHPDVSALETVRADSLSGEHADPNE